MRPDMTRRRLLGAAAAGGAMLGLGGLSFLSRLRPVSAAEAHLDPALVRLQPEIEPLVRVLEETPRERLLEEVAHRIQKGLGYRDLLAALLLAGVRNVQPRPAVGFKFHAVLVVNSAHLASLASPDTDRWLPIFWSLDYFKASQAETKRESGWRMGPVDEAKVPPARKARQAFVEAMDRWDEDAADAAAAALARTAGAAEVYELMWRYGARDFRSIGHKAIFVANSWRTLQCIGWRHAEPVLRSLTYALLNREGAAGNPSENDFPADRPWRTNMELGQSIQPQWLEGAVSDEATVDLLATLRQGSERDAAQKAAAMLNDGVSPQSIWDALLAGGGELLMRRPGIVALHALTTANALRFAYQTSGDDQTRRMLLMQGASFLPLFRNAMGDAPPLRIDELQPEERNTDVESIFTDVGQDRMAAARKALAYLRQGQPAAELANVARRMVFLKGTDAHDYKFSSALLEDYGQVSPNWRDRYFAAGMFQLRGSSSPDNQLVKRARAALAS